MNKENYLHAKKIQWEFEKEAGKPLPHNLDLSPEDFIHPYDHLSDPSFISFDPKTFQLIGVQLYNTKMQSLDFFNHIDLSHLRALQIEKTPLKTIPSLLSQIPLLTYFCIRDCDLEDIPESFWGKENLYSVDFSGNRLNSLPDSISIHPELEYLKLERNNFEKIPDLAFKSPRLLTLDMKNNKITEIPDGITRLKELYKIDLSYNNVHKITEKFGALNNLQYLYLENNLISKLPKSFGNLICLEDISLSNNKLTTLPQSFGSLKNLKKLRIDDNLIAHLPKSFQKLTNLTDLDLTNNHIEGFHFEMDSCPNLDCIDLSGTNFQDFSSLHAFPNLETIILEDFQFRKIPSDLLTLLKEKRSLKRINLSNNLFRTYPKEVLSILKQRFDLYDSYNFNINPKILEDRKETEESLADFYSLYPDGETQINLKDRIYDLDEKLEYLDFFYFQENPFSLEERFFLQEIFVVEPSESLFENYKNISDAKKIEFYKLNNQKLIKYLELGEEFLPKLFNKIEHDQEFSYLDYHHPDLLLHSEEIRLFCQTKTTENSKSFQDYLNRRLEEFKAWKIEEKDQIDRDFDLCGDGN